MATSTIPCRKALLWSNSNTGGMDSQVITLDLTPYDEVEILCTFTSMAENNGTLYKTETAPVPTSNAVNQLSFVIWNIDTGQSGYASLNMVYRPFKINPSGIGVGAGYMFYNGNRYEGWQNRCVPQKIWGIKSNG